MKKLFLLAFVAATIYGCNSPRVADYDIVPLPLTVELLGEDDASDGFVLDKNAVIVYSDPALLSPAGFLAGYVEELTGLRLRTSAEPVGHSITLSLTDGYAPEGYSIKIEGDDVFLEASSPAGVFWGVQTLRKSIPGGGSGKIVFPQVIIEDAPRLAWRGMHFDVARHFFDIKAIERYIDIMVLHNLNTLHFHLTDDQGWRIEIEKYPRLTEVGAWRKDENGDTIGGFFTQDEIRHIVDYAAQRFVTIVPEIDMPGHMVAALAAYPELGCTGGPYAITGQPGVMREILCGGSDETMTFLKDIFTEITELFPGEYIHIGGDEAPKYYWERCPRCQAKIRSLGLYDKGGISTAENQLQGWITNEIEMFLAGRGRKIIGWDELLEGDNLAREAAIMSWRGSEGGIAAAQKGHKVVMAPNTSLYFDYYQSTDYATEPDAIGGLNTMQEVFMTEVFPRELTPEQRQLVIGVQAALWTEYIDNMPQVEYMLLPRMGALSEIAWRGGRTVNDEWNFGKFLRRMERLVEIYEHSGYNAAGYMFDVTMNAVPDFVAGNLAVTLSAAEGTEIHYTLDGTEPTRGSSVYADTLRISTNTDLRAVAFMGKHLTSKMLSADFRVNKATMKPITSRTATDPRYDIRALVDGLNGKRDFTLGNWVGYRRANMDVTIDLGAPTAVSRVRARTLLDYGSHIMEATRFAVGVSNDGVNFKTVAERSIAPVDLLRMKDLIDHEAEFETTTARYVRVEMDCAPELPREHILWGEDPFLFVDEIEIY